MTGRRPILCLDFDGVIHQYVTPWAGATVIPDPSVPGAREFLLAALDRFDVCVVSSRSHEPGGPEAMARWMRRQMGGAASELAVSLEEAADWVWRPDETDYSRVVRFPRHKPPAHVTLDDRALTFSGMWPTVESLLAFRSWNRGGVGDIVEVPAEGSDDRQLWLEAAERCGFEPCDNGCPRYAVGEEKVLRLMAVAREQGRRDVLGLEPRALEDRT